MNARPLACGLRVSICRARPVIRVCPQSSVPLLDIHPPTDHIRPPCYMPQPCACLRRHDAVLPLTDVTPLTFIA